MACRKRNQRLESAAHRDRHAVLDVARDGVAKRANLVHSRILYPLDHFSSTVKSALGVFCDRGRAISLTGALSLRYFQRNSYRDPVRRSVSCFVLIAELRSKKAKISAETAVRGSASQATSPR